MSAMAGTLGVTLSKQGIYELAGGQTAPDGLAIRRALSVADICVGLSVILFTAMTLWPGVTTATIGRKGFNERSF